MDSPEHDPDRGGPQDREPAGRRPNAPEPPAAPKPPPVPELPLIPESPAVPEPAARPAMSPELAIAVVVAASAAVLVLEVLSVRLVAPYAGLTLETYTASIGVALGAIAFGAALGGRAADALARPVALVGPLLVAGGVLFLFARPIVLVVGPALRGTGPLGALILVALGIAVPVAVLSALPPVVVKTQLSRLAETGTVVGRFSALGTLGALAGTFLTGYVLLATLPTSRVLLVTGVLLAGSGAWLTIRYRGRRSGGPQALGALVLGVAGLVAVDSPCDIETPYYCLRVATDADRTGGRVLYLDDLRHAYVDLDDPRHLEFSYMQRMADVIDTMAPPGRPLSALHIGGGGFTLPRWLAATRPESHSRVLELDPEVVRVGRERLGLRTGPNLQVRLGDARQGITDEPDSGYDLVVGDAFGSLSLPWHLATTEFAAEVRRVLRPGGLYVLNVIDNPPLRFLAAELATLRAEFPQVTVVGNGEQLDGTGGGNFVLVAGTRVPDRAALNARAGSRGAPDRAAEPAQLDRLRGDATALSDDDAPVDQLLTPYRTSRE